MVVGDILRHGWIQDCKREFEKTCRIIIEKREYNETVSSCMRPLQRVCPTPAGGSVVERIRRETGDSLQGLAEQLDDTPAGASVESFSSPDQAGCSLYHERICRTESSSPGSPRSLSSVLGSDCSRLPVRLCAEDCEVREGPLTCKTLPVTTVREQPEERCEIRPSKTCRTVRRLQPQLVPQTRCSLNPKEICHIKCVLPYSQQP